MINIIVYQTDGHKSKNNLSCITMLMFMKVFPHNNPPTLFEVINCLSMIDGHVHHIMKVLEDSNPHFDIFDFFSTT
jgi:hypothetical protein